MKTVLVLVMLVLVAVVLAGGAAFMMQQNRLAQLKRVTAQAEEKLERKDYSDAIPLLKRVYDEAHTARSTLLLGKAFYSQEKPSEAINYFNEVERKHADSGYLPEAIMYQGRYALEVEGNRKKAKDTFLRILEKYPDSEMTDYALYYLSKLSFDEGNITQTKKNLEQIVRKSDSPVKDDAEFMLGSINMKQIRSPEPGPNDDLYTIKKGDSLWKLERELKVPQDLLQSINHLKPTALSIGQQIKVPRLNLSLVVDKSKRTLTVRNNDVFLAKFRVGISRVNERVPTGDYTVTGKHDKGFEYVDPDSNVLYKADDPANPLGKYFIELRRGLGIHGTDRPEEVGTYIAKGMIAMTNQDIEDLYPLLRIGTPVRIKGQKLMTENSTETR